MPQCTEEAPDLPTLQYDFTSIADIESIEPNTLIGWTTYMYMCVHVTGCVTVFIDVVGVCKSAAEVSSVTLRTTSKQVMPR